MNVQHFGYVLYFGYELEFFVCLNFYISILRSFVVSLYHEFPTWISNMNCLSLFDQFVGLVLTELIFEMQCSHTGALTPHSVLAVILYNYNFNKVSIYSITMLMESLNIERYRNRNNYMHLETCLWNMTGNFRKFSAHMSWCTISQNWDIELYV